MRNKLVQNQSGNKGANDGFNSRQLGQKGSKKDHRQYENIVGMLFILQFPKKPLRNSGNDGKHDYRENSQRNYQTYPELLIQTSLTIAHNYSQNDKHGSIC